MQLRTYIVSGCLTVLFVVAGAWDADGEAAAQMVVSDPTNLVQNTASQMAEAEQVVQQAQEIQNQLQQLEQMRKDLEKLDASSLEDLNRSFRKLEELYERGRQISMKYQQIEDQFEAFYEEFDPEEDDVDSYRDKRDKWEKQTDEAVFTAMRTHGVVDRYEWRRKDLSEDLSRSGDADGTLAAIQAGNRIAGVLARQMMELTQIIVADSRARLSYIKEQKMQEEQERRRRQKQMLEGWGERSDSPTFDDELPEIR
jgi:P-type conjugative transfer protein TrbJ